MTSEAVQTPLPEPLVRLEKAILRPHHASDGPSIVLACNTKGLARWLTSAFPYPYTLADAETWLTIADPSRDFVIAALDNVTVMGGIALKPQTDIHHRTAEIGYWLGEEYWGRGIMSEVVKAFCQMMFERQPQLVRIQADVVDGNTGSCRVLEKAGFVSEGRRRCAVEKDGVVRDLLGYAMVREGW